MKTKLFTVALISMFTIIMVNCSKEEPIKNEVQEEMDVKSILDNYHFFGEPPTVIQEKSGKSITKTIKFFETEGLIEFSAKEECGSYPYATVTGSGNATHIGKYHVLNIGCYDGVSPILGFITAANGDEIHTYVASAEQDPETEIWTYHYIIYNGTGRFLNATGEVFMTGVIDTENLVWKLKGEGTIFY